MLISLYLIWSKLVSLSIPTRFLPNRVPQDMSHKGMGMVCCLTCAMTYALGEALNEQDGSTVNMGWDYQTMGH